MMSHSSCGAIKRVVVFCCTEQVLMVQAIIKLLNPLLCRRRHLLIARRMQRVLAIDI